MQKYCNSCGMPLGKTDDCFGNNKDGSKNYDYCNFCFPKGEFNNPSETIEQMIETCVPHLAKAEGLTEDEAKDILDKRLPKLKRWLK